MPAVGLSLDLEDWRGMQLRMTDLRSVADGCYALCNRSCDGSSDAYLRVSIDGQSMIVDVPPSQNGYGCFLTGTGAGDTGGDDIVGSEALHEEYVYRYQDCARMSDPCEYGV